MGLTQSVMMRGLFRRGEPLICANDDDAVAKASALLDGRDIELWTGARLVVRLSAPALLPMTTERRALFQHGSVASGTMKIEAELAHNYLETR
jgi:hypothetical protein